jgi:type II secretory pathway predicted ATPase ExeA
MEQQSAPGLFYARFGMSLNPFAVTPDPRFFMRSRTHLDALASMIYGIRERKGFICMTGNVGTGKTTLINTLLGSLDVDVLFSHIIYTDLSFLELLQMICADFGIKVARQSKVELMNELFDYLVQTRIKGLNALVVIDEAQNLNAEVLESLRMLSNFETSREKLIQILLVGQPELKRILKRPELRQLAQRIVVRTELSPMSQTESEKYIYHRLSVAGSEGEAVFPRDIATRIAELSGGIPRIINILCDNCLLRTFAEGTTRVTPSVLEAVRANYFEAYDSRTFQKFEEEVDGGRPSPVEMPEPRKTNPEFAAGVHLRQEPVEDKGVAPVFQRGKRKKTFMVVAAFVIVAVLGAIAWGVFIDPPGMQRLIDGISTWGTAISGGGRTAP